MIELTVPVCTVHQKFLPCPPCVKQQARLRRQNLAAMGWMLLFSVFLGAVIWFSVGAR
ncbi:hypothetical protein PP568_13135 [Mycobacteroides abscessus]|jgi:hypothetical protein|uniref:Transmembrane protein n=1 Tax=Mycobacteroides abscessus subsp. abscessus TaxID=1185650 RepID=A0AB38D4S7_9MYCO|nr:hypothetical protein [Mycobacteroides abscessus]QSM03229.1 hypothetical protein PROPHIGD102-2_25 [Mycobacterium phage prophi102-2]QSM03999.1 hypothetical protein PROPHIGD54-1_25 [Mycobacterium phage prophiGD54-1]MBE5420174.1 hypothetical protein [Mycobacteroides abscessus]MBE5455127.1 hypothetical protein [Mycobacteroides abscessus]MBN7296728.1 hypothetical protein [Mycobacteroides abscessus subsp. abscessus]